MALTSPREERNWVMACHLAALAGFFGIPFGNIFGPLVVWLLKKGDSALIAQQGKEALNFQISMSLYMIAASFLIFIAVGVVALVGLIVSDLVLVIIAAIKVNGGEDFRYPLTIRFFR